MAGDLGDFLSIEWIFFQTFKRVDGSCVHIRGVFYFEKEMPRLSGFLDSVLFYMFIAFRDLFCSNQGIYAKFFRRACCILFL
jgi:hypothetical protein